MTFHEWLERHEWEVKNDSKYIIHKTPKELCSRHGETTVDVTIACSNITSKVCTNCGLE